MKFQYFIHLTAQDDGVTTGISLRPKPSADENAERSGELHVLLTHARMLALGNLNLLRKLAEVSPDLLPEGSLPSAMLAWLELSADFLTTGELRSLQEEARGSIAELHTELILRKLTQGGSNAN